MKTKHFLWLLSFVTLIVLSGCQSDVIEEAESLVFQSESKGVKLSDELDFEKRIEKYGENAFSSIEKSDIEVVSLTIEDAESTLKEIKDSKTRKELQKRLDKVEEIVNNANVYNNALSEGDKFATEKDELLAFVQSNPLSSELDKRLEDYKTREEIMQSLKAELIGDKLKSEYEGLYLADKDYIMSTISSVISSRNGVLELEKLLTDGAENSVIDAKIVEVDKLVASVEDTTTRDILGSKQSEIVKPYSAKVTEEKRVAEEKRLAEEKAKSEADAKKVSTSSKQSSSTKTTTSNSSTIIPSSSNTTTSTPSTSTPSTETSTPEPTYTGLVALAAPVCKKYGLEVIDMTVGDLSQGTCGPNGGSFSKGMVLHKNVELAVDIAIAIGCTGSRSEMIESAKQAIANPHTQVKGNGYIAQSDRGAKVSFVW